MVRTLVSLNRKILKSFSVHPTRGDPQDARGLKIRFEKLRTHDVICKIKKLVATSSEHIKSTSAFLHMVGCRLMERTAQLKLTSMRPSRINHPSVARWVVAGHSFA